MSTNFFTNEKDNTLLEKIQEVFEHRKVHFFDALVGYFRASGYFRIRKFIEQTPQIRILVGINIDKLTYEANRNGLLFNPNEAQMQEVLAEGVNLHRANVIVNYDTPWNSTRLMQRIGRVNRIGSTAKEVHIYNFFPTAKVNDDIELEKKAKMKLFAFHAALGEDSQIYSTDEMPESFGLFDKTIDEERDEKLRYLMYLRKVRDEQPELIKRIRKMPLRARVGRKSKLLTSSTLTFIRNDRRDAFNFIREDGSIEELTFLEAVKEFGKSCIFCYASTF